MSRPDTAQVAKAIADGNGSEHDSWVKHRAKFAGLDIHSREDLQAHIERTLNSKNTVVIEVRGATIYVDHTTRTAVVHDPSRPDQGTVFRPDSTAATDEYVRAKTGTARKQLGRQPLVVTGGHDAFYDAKEQRDAAVRGAEPLAAPSQVAGHKLAAAGGREVPVARVAATDAAQTQAGGGGSAVAEQPGGSAPNIAKRVADSGVILESTGGVKAGAQVEALGAGTAARAGGAALKAAGRALGPLGVAVNAATLEAGYEADGKQIGAHTARAASGIAGGWAGAVAGAEGGALAGAAVGSVVPVVGTAAGAAAGGVVGAVAGGVTGGWVGRRVFDRVKGMFGSPAESEAPAASPRPEAAPKVPASGGVPIARAGAASTTDAGAGAGAGTASAWANTAAAGSDGAVDANRARAVEARVMWHASVADGRSETAAARSGQSGVGVSTVPAADGRAAWSSLAQGAAAAHGSVGTANGPGASGRAGTLGTQAAGPEALASGRAGESAAAAGRSVRLRA